MSHYIKYYFSSLCLLLGLSIFSQSNNLFTENIFLDLHQDSSFYDIEQVAPNCYWIGGENGVLKIVDSTGYIINEKIIDIREHILSIKKSNIYVFIACNKAKLYRYNLSSAELTCLDLSDKLKKACFYDMTTSIEGDLLICGGHSKIMDGNIAIPRGFVIKVNPSFNTPFEIVWKNIIRFGWTIESCASDSSYMLSAYNGVKTKILKSSSQGEKWKTNIRVKGIVHSLVDINHVIWYSGSKNFRYRKDGIIGNTDLKKPLIFNTGSVWSLNYYNGKLLGTTHSGTYITVDSHTLESTVLVPVHKYPVYDLVRLNKQKMLMAGSGKNSAIISF